MSNDLKISVSAKTIGLTILAIVSVMTLGFLGRVIFFSIVFHEVQSDAEKFMEIQKAEAAERAALVEAQRENARLLRERQEAAKRAAARRAAHEAEQLDLIKKQKAAAWASYFQTSEDCLVWRSNSRMVKCQNVEIRARKAFDEAWELEHPGITLPPDNLNVGSVRY